MDDLVKLLTDSSIVVNRIAQILEQNNIKGHMKDNVESARVAGFGVPQNSVELYVLESEMEKARKLIEEFRKENS